jgi:hypothetical protein
VTCLHLCSFDRLLSVFSTFLGYRFRSLRCQFDARPSNPRRVAYSFLELTVINRHQPGFIRPAGSSFKMIGFLSQKPRSASLLGAALLLLGHITPVVIGLKTTPGSPCANVCNKVSSNTTASEIVCLDEQFSQTTKGSDFQNCVECQLESTYGDSSSGQRDVEWGLCTYSQHFGDNETCSR